MKKLLTLISMVVLVAIAAAASMVAFNKTSSPVSQQVDLKNSRNATLFDKYGGMKIVTSARRAEAMNDYGIITEPDEGEARYYTISGIACSFSDDQIQETEQSGIATVVYCADSTVYMKPIVSNYSSNAWVRGRVVDNTLVFPIGQPIAYNANWNTTLSIYWCEANTLLKAEEQADIVFAIVGDNLELQNSSSELLLGVFWDDDNSWTWSGVFGTVLTLNTEYKPASTELVVLPDGAEVEDWYLMGKGTSEVLQNIKVAFVENEIYVSGLSNYFPDSWIKGTIDSTSVSFPSLQFVGAYGSYNVWAMGFNWDSEVQPAFTMSYDAENGTLVLDENQLLAFNADENRLYYLSYCWTLVLTKDVSIFNAYTNLNDAISQAQELLNNAILTRDGINMLNEAINAANEVMYSCDVNAMTASYEELNRVIAQVQETEIRTISVWTIAGSTELLGSIWDVTDTNNDMTEDENGNFVLSKENIKLVAGIVYEFKVAGDHSWDINYGLNGIRDGQNVQLTVGQSGIYNVNFYFYPNNNNGLTFTCELISTDTHDELVYNIDYSDYKGFPFYVLGYVPEWYDGVMTAFGANYGYKTDDEMADFTGGTEVGTVTTAGGTIYHKVLLDSPSWHQYFIADGIPTQMGGRYKVVAKVRTAESVTFNVNMSWGWAEGQQLAGQVYIPQSNEFVEVEWEYDGIGGTSCYLVAQPGSFEGTIEWQWLKIYEVKSGQASEFSNVMYFGENTEFMKGQYNELSVNLQNSRQIKACQFDLVLPEGVYINGIYNTWRSEWHSVNYEMLANGNVRVVVVSTEGNSFYGNNGAILNMVFNVDGDLDEGDYTLGMKNIEMTTTDYETLRPEDQYITVHVKNLLMGDVDSNGEVNVTDVVLIIDQIVGRYPWNFNADAADVNYDGYINITDVVLVIDHVLGKVNLNRAAATDAEMGAISLSSDMKTVSLTNPSAYTAFQMDVTLPKGVSLEDVLLTERAARSHSVVIREMENGSYRIVGVSMKNDAFKGNVGDLLQLQLTGNAQGSVAIDNVLFVTPQGVQHELAGVNAFGDVTGISDALRLNDNGQLINDNVFDLQGRQVNNAQLKKGLYILNGKKQIVK